MPTMCPIKVEDFTGLAGNIYLCYNLIGIVMEVQSKTLE